MVTTTTTTPTGPQLIGRAIYRARKACGLTQKQLGLRLGLKGGPQAVYRWERAINAPTARTAKLLLNAVAALNPTAAAALEATLRNVLGEQAFPSASVTTSTAQQARPSEASHGGNATATAAQRGTQREGGATSPHPPTTPEQGGYLFQRQVAIEYLVLRMADELDVSPRRVRIPVWNLLRRLQSKGIPLGVALQEVGALIEQANANTVPEIDLKGLPQAPSSGNS